MTQKKSQRSHMSDKFSDQRGFRNPNIDSDNNNGDDGDDEQDFRYHHHRSSSSPSSLCVNSSYVQQPSSTTMGSWGFDVNRSVNGQIPLSFTLNNNNNSEQQQTITKTTTDYNERSVDVPSSRRNFNLRTPTLTRQKNGNEFDAVDRLVLGPNRLISSSNESSKPTEMVSANQSRTDVNNSRKLKTEQELLAWQTRMLEREHRIGNSLSNVNNKRNGLNTPQTVARHIPTSVRPTSAMSNNSENQSNEYEYNETMIKSARVIKRYIELLYHLQSYYERVIESLFDGNTFTKSNQTIFNNHCRKIFEQIQKSKPIWEEKLTQHQHLLRNLSSLEWSKTKNETTLLLRRLSLINVIQTLNSQKDLDDTDMSIRNDIDRILNEDVLAVQLHDELSTLLEHQSLLNDFTSILQWNQQLYSSNEQNRVENILPLLREQITTTDNYISHVSQQVNELVMNMRALEKYILSYTNAIPSIDDGIVPFQRTSLNRGRINEEMDLERLRGKNRNGNINDDTQKKRSISMPRHVLSNDTDQDYDREIKRRNQYLNTNENREISTPIETVKSVKYELKSPPTSILKQNPSTRLSNRRKLDFDLAADTLKPSTTDRFIDTNRDPEIVLTNERSNNYKTKDEIRNIQLKSNTRDHSEKTFETNDIRSSLHHRQFDKEHEKIVNFQSLPIDVTKEKNLTFAGKHYRTNFPQQNQLNY